MYSKKNRNIFSETFSENDLAVLTFSQTLHKNVFTFPAYFGFTLFSASTFSHYRLKYSGFDFYVNLQIYFLPSLNHIY